MNRRLLAASTAVALGVALPHLASAQGVRFTLAPSAEYINWDKKLGIEDDALVGGRIGADFGSLINVSGYYHIRNDLKVSRDSASALMNGIVGPLNAKTDVTTYGVNLALRLNPGRIAPFLSVGAGIISFNSDSLKRRDLINYRYGGGIAFDLAANARARLMVEDSRFRMSPNSLFGMNAGANTGSGSALPKDNELSNLTYSASLGFALGGDVGKDDPRDEKWSLASVPIEAFAGRLDFDGDAQKRQAVIGARAGVDVGQYVGLRGYYWQGRSGDLRDRQDIQSYGGEAQFNLNASLGPAPYLILGAGQLDYGKDYRDNLGRTRDKETALILGGGIGLRLSDQVRLNASARDYVRGPQDLDSIGSASQLTHNWLYSVGLGINIGRSRSDVNDGRRNDDRSRDMRDADDRDRMSRDNDDMRSSDGRNMQRMRTDTVYIERDPRTGDRVYYRRNPRTGRLERVPDRVPERMQNQRMSDDTQEMRIEREMTRAMDGRTVTLPVPANGELYVRYGDSSSTRGMNPMGGMRPNGMQNNMQNGNGMNAETESVIAALRARINQLDARLANVAADSTATNSNSAETRALRASIDSLETVVRMQRNQQSSQPNVVVVPNNNSGMVDRRVDRGGVMIMPVDTAGSVVGDYSTTSRDFMGMQLNSVSPYIGGFDQFIIGVQGDAGPILGVSSLRFVPDFAIGLGEDPSIALAAGAQYNFGLFRLSENSAIRPHLRASLGFVAASGSGNSHFGINVAYGLTYAGRSNLVNGNRPQLFIEHQGIEFFDANRFVLGLRVPVR